MAVRERPTTDPGGKLVDVHDYVRYVSAIVFEPKPDLEVDRVVDAVLDTMRKLGRSTRKRLRERAFTIWFGSFSSAHTERLRRQGVIGTRWALGLPDNFQSDVHIMFQETSRRLGKLIDIGRAEVTDLAASPLARYDRGVIRLYADPFLAPSIRDDGIEVRSAEVATPPPERRRRNMLPKRAPQAPCVHDVDTWTHYRDEILSHVWEMETESSYATLSAFVRSYGINVREETASSFTKLGRITCEALADDGATVTIAIRASLPSELKYVALAHELAHYVRHFPLLYARRVAQELGKFVPEVVDYVQATEQACLGEGWLLEYDANLFASYFLLPPMYNVDALASMVLEGGRELTGAELAWRFLQPHFPENARQWADLSWSTVDAAEAAFRSDAQRVQAAAENDEGSLYESMLLALLTRSTPEGERRINTVTEGVFLVHNELGELLNRFDLEGGGKFDD